MVATALTNGVSHKSHTGDRGIARHFKAGIPRVTRCSSPVATCVALFVVGWLIIGAALVALAPNTSEADDLPDGAPHSVPDDSGLSVPASPAPVVSTVRALAGARSARPAALRGAAPRAAVGAGADTAGARTVRTRGHITGVRWRGAARQNHGDPAVTGAPLTDPLKAVTAEPKLKRPIGCPEAEVARCSGQASQSTCVASPCCAWTTDLRCMAVNHHEQLWVGFAAHRNGFTNQYMTYLKHFLMIETLLNFVDEQWDLCIVLPRVVRSIVPPVRREDEELGGTVDGPWSQLFAPGAAAAFIEQLWRAIGAQGHRRPRQVFVFDDAPDAVPMPTIFAGRVNVRGQWHVDDPERAFLREQEVIGHEWVPDAKFQTCEGGGFKSLTGKRGRDGPLYRDPRLDLAPYNSPEAVAQRLALKLPYRALAGEGALVHTMFTCGPIFRGELITPGRVDALTPGAVPTSLAKTVIDRLRAMSIESGGNGRYSSMHIRLERDWAVACEESHSDACLSEHALAEVPRCLQWKHSLDKLLYVATGEETARSQVMRTFKLYMRRNVGVTVVTKFDMGDDVATLFKSDDARYGRVSREELAAAEYAIVHDASSFMGWAVGTTFSWVQVLRAGAVQGRPAFFFANDCPGMLDEKYLMYKPFHKGYTPFTPPPRPSDYAGRAEWDMHFDNAQRLAQWNEAARDS